MALDIRMWHYSTTGTASASSTVWHMEVRLLSHHILQAAILGLFMHCICFLLTCDGYMVLHYAHTLRNAVSAGDMVMDGSYTTTWNSFQ